MPELALAWCVGTQRCATGPWYHYRREGKSGMIFNGHGIFNGTEKLYRYPRLLTIASIKTMIAKR